MNNQKKQCLRQDVKLHPLRIEHAPEMYKWMCDPEVSRHIGLRSEPTLDNSIRWVEKSLQDSTNYSLAILLNQRYVGNVVLDRIDEYLRSARFSIYLGEADARGSGVGFTAAYLSLLEGFTKLNLHKIWLTVHCENFRAINAYSKLGFVLEGVLRDEFLLKERFLSVFYMGMLQSEFESIHLNFSEN